MLAREQKRERRRERERLVTTQFYVHFSSMSGLGIHTYTFTVIFKPLGAGIPTSLGYVRIILLICAMELACICD